jgi:hypothetical protein
MKNFSTKRLALSLMIGVLAPIAATGDIDFKEAINLTSMEEAMTSSVSLLDFVEPLTWNQALNWSSAYSASGWSCSLSGVLNDKDLNLSMSGSLVGNQGEDIVVSFSGIGSWGIEPIEITEGETSWFYDSENNDYINFDFQQLLHLGSESDRAWSTGLDWGGGATLGAIAGACALLPFGPITAAGGGVIGAIMGGEAAASLSKRAQSWFLSPPPAIPEDQRPNPNPGDDLAQLA